MSDRDELEDQEKKKREEEERRRREQGNIPEEIRQKTAQFNDDCIQRFVPFLCVMKDADGNFLAEQVKIWGDALRCNTNDPLQPYLERLRDTYARVWPQGRFHEALTRRFGGQPTSIHLHQIADIYSKVIRWCEYELQKQVPAKRPAGWHDGGFDRNFSYPPTPQVIGPIPTYT